MIKKPHQALLPPGMVDLLPPEAEFEARTTERLIAAFRRNGYELIKPPLVEFEENLITGSGAATAAQTFRLMDPDSQRMLAIRADMTLQISRIASSRLSDLPRPLRLSYAGQVLRIKGSNLRPQRQFGQVGAELIGSGAPAADVEIIIMTANSLKDLGITEISIDLGIPTLVNTICGDLGITDEVEKIALRTALNQKDAASISALNAKAASIFSVLLSAVGPVDKSLEILKKMHLPPQAERELDHLKSVVSELKNRAPEISLTVDPVEIRGYEYHSYLTFTIFSKGIRGELGRGGRYISTDSSSSDVGEMATGVTLFIDTLLNSLPNPLTTKRMFVPLGSNKEAIQKFMSEGWIAIAELVHNPNQPKEALRLGCTHILQDGELKKL